LPEDQEVVPGGVRRTPGQDQLMGRWRSRPKGSARQRLKWTARGHQRWFPRWSGYTQWLKDTRREQV